MEANNDTSSPAASQTAGRAAGYTFNINRVSLGYGVAIAVGMMVLVCTMMLVCVRLHMGRGSVAQAAAARRRRRRLAQPRPGAEPDPDPDHAAVVHVAGADWPSVEGLDEETLQSYPKIMYAVHVDGADAPALPPGVKDGSCSICLGDYSDGETLRLLPDCGHVFHAHCIDAWLRLHATCPMCRSSPLPTPVSTPLSELIPLARNPLQHQHHHENLPR